MALALSFSQEEGDGLFLCNWAKYLKLDEELEKIEARSDLDDLSDLRNLIQREPDFLDARVSLGMHCYRNDDFGNAKAVAETGLAVANELIPARFKGTIAWLRVENRAFLRLLSLAALSNARLGRHGEALAHIMRSMKYNPDDELGLRGVLGSELLRTGEDATAKRCLANHAPDFPECFYELGLAHLLDEEWALAATALRLRIPVKLNSDSGICEHHFRKVCGQGFFEQKLSFEGRHLFDSLNKPAAKRSAAVVDPRRWNRTVHLTSEYVH